MNKKKWLLTSLIVCSTLLTACTDNTKMKKDALTAVNKQIEMKNYTFAGGADIDLGVMPQAKDSNPITSNLLAMFEKSVLEWSGVTSTDPVRLEINLKSTPAAVGSPLELPMIIKDNKLYVNIPLLNRKDEYFAIDLATLGSMSGGSNPLTPESLKNVSQLTSSVSSIILNNVQDKWFKKAADLVTLPDGAKATVITVEITDKNKQEISSLLQTKLPDIIDSMNKNGIISAAQADKLKQTDLKSIQVQPPGIVALTIDTTGYIREQKFELAYTMKNKDGVAENRHLKWHQKFDQINQNPNFTKDVPKQTRPFEDVLKYLMGTKK